jgi:hypothetical protein
MADTKKVKARVLVDCAFGKADDIVEVTEGEAKASANEIDTNKDAVAFAEKLQAEKKAAA